MEYDIGDRALKILPEKMMNIIDATTSSYCYILTSPKWLHIIKQAYELSSVLCDIESDHIREKDDRKKRVIE